MYEPSALEQYMLELVNAERAKVGAQPLTFDLNLDKAAELHSQWMIATDTFSHTGDGGSSATQRMQSAGYTLSGSWATGENIAWASLRGAPGYQDEVDLLHTNLMNSAGHRANILNANYREVGIGFEVGEYQGWQGAFVTQDFGKSGTGLSITGVAFDDQDGDRFYDPGEGLGGLTVKAVSSTGASFTTSTVASGGYDLTLSSGTYTLTFSGGGFTTVSKQVTVGSLNVKVDLIDPVAGGGTTPVPPTQPPSTPGPVVGTSGADTLAGTGGADTLQGMNGGDRLSGGGGADRLDGGAGNDTLNGGVGADVLSGGSGNDTFVFDLAPSTGVDQITDFTTADTIQLENAIFTALGSTGRLSSSAFYQGSASHDATDRVIYNSSTGSLLYDADGTGSGSAVQIAILPTGLRLSYADFSVI
ncbi:MAG: CAP domain-containing protein [Phenylobacterium sp.]|uniref:CAP domain-containing protein n=1 Tax=Phenylobacterium sp. TaxID=1871053 RepID=UPI002736DC82|nr:CAP domain-containing protein [Phenylobacterium sp.]MDP3172914.1 CAP domain-containing protein [Phenylobacterium sp.]